MGDHICFVLPPYEVYSPTRGLALAIVTAEVTRELRAQGVRTTVVSPSEGGDLYDGGEVIATGFDDAAVGRSFATRLRSRLVGWDIPGYATYLSGVRAAVAAAAPDVVVLHNDLVTGGLLKRRNRDLRVHAWLANETTTRRRTGLRLLSRTDGLLAVSSYIADWARGAYGDSAPPVTLVPNGVDPEVFCPPTPWPPTGASTATGPLRTCFVGRIDPNKGPLEAVEAVVRAQRRGLDVTIDVAGPVKAWGQSAESADRYASALRHAIDESGGQWVGSVSRDDLPDFYRRYELAFVPSIANEPFGLVALEAMASGCAVIASNRGGLPEVCGSAARLIDPEDPVAFDGALDDACRDRLALGSEREAARRHAFEHTWAITADLLLAAVSGSGEAVGG